MRVQNNMSVKNMKKLKTSPVVGSTPPLEWDVALPCSMTKETKSLSDSKLLAIMTAVVEASMRNVLSGDVWSLTFIQARHTCEKVGISAEDFDNVLLKLIEAREKRFKSNPMSSMF